jgi:hypothetical protein
MAVRLVIVSLVLAWGYWKGGSAGVLFCLFVLPFILGRYEPTMPSEARTEAQKGIENDGEELPARRGRRNPDPTRPRTSDYAGMIEYRKNFK